MLTVYIVTTVLIVIITRFLMKHRAKVAYFHTFPGPPPQDFHHITGNLHLLHQWGEKGIASQLEFLKKNKYFCRIFYGAFHPVIHCFHPDVVKTLYKNSIKPTGNFFARSGNEMGLAWIGEGLLLSQTGPKWQRNRRLITPAFHFDILKTYVNVFNTTADIFVEKIGQLSAKSKSFDISALSCLQSLDAILRCAFSFESHCQERGSDYIKAITELAILWNDRGATPPHYNDLIYALSSKGRRFAKLCKTVHDVSSDVIVKRREAIKSNPIDSRRVRDFLDTLLTAKDSEGQGLSFIEIRNEVDTFMFAGHDTTAMGITFTLYCLAKHPEYQEKVFQEVSEICGDKENLDWEDLNKLHITTLVIKESLRLFPPVPMIGRHSDLDLDVCGYKVPKGTLFVICIFALHRNPHLWEEPDKFIPERFETDKLKLMDPYQYLPFSAGSRNCIGQNFAMTEIKTVIPKVVRNFRISLDEDKPLKRKFAVTISSENGVNLFFHPRGNKSE